ncbi:MAG: MFS transporter [Acetobacteraceae bacterium]|nr:MFS transporter [Acetobacteraceae bacterium]
MRTAPAADGIESAYAWWRLAASVGISTIGGIGLWSLVVALPTVQVEFGIARADASLPYTLTMLGFMVGGVIMGRLADRHGVIVPALVGTISLAIGYIGASFATGLWTFALAYAVAIGTFGSSAVFAPLVADSSHWFDRRRGIAVALASCGSYFAGALWPPVLQALIEDHGWRTAHFAVGVFCLVTMLPLTLVLRRPSPVRDAAPGTAAAAAFPARPFGLPPNGLQGLLMFAGFSCCVAMAMPQVHIVAHCVDLGFGAARGAEMLSLMLATGVVSRLASGFIMDRVGGVATLLLFASLQAVALALFIPFDGLVTLYIASAVFGLFQGGLVPAYAIIVRECFPPSQAGTRVGLVLSSTLAGMAFGGWISGAIFDATASYQMAVVHGIVWNLVTMAIALWMLQRGQRRPAFA